MKKKPSVTNSQGGKQKEDEKEEKKLENSNTNI